MAKHIDSSPTATGLPGTGQPTPAAAPSQTQYTPPVSTTGGKHIDTVIRKVDSCGLDATPPATPVSQPTPLPPSSTPPPVAPPPPRVVFSVNGKTGVVALRSGDIPEYANLYFTAARAEEAARYAFSALDPLSYDISTGVFSLIQPHITAVGEITSGVWHGSVIGTEYGGTGLSSYSYGDLLLAGVDGLTKLPIGLPGQFLGIVDTLLPSVNWANPTTADIPESGNLYFTEDRVLSTVLSGLSVQDVDVDVSDTVLSAIGKLQGQINASSGGTTGSAGTSGTSGVAGTSGSSGTSGVGGSLGYVPVNKAGDTMTGDLVGKDFVRTRSGTIARVNGYVSQVALTGGRTINVTRSSGYISSINDGTRTWTYTRDVNHNIISWSVT